MNKTELTPIQLLQELDQKNWKVGINKGTAPKDFKDSESYPLKPDTYWERKYTGDLVKLNYLPFL